MTKSLFLITLIFACAFAANIRAHREEWTKIDVNNLSDSQKGIDEFIRDKLGALSGDLKGAAQSGNLYRYAYLSGEK